MRARLTVLSTISSQLSTSASHCFFADLFRTNAHCVFHRKNEYFSIANLARLGCGDYHIDRPLHHVVCHHHFHFYFWQEIHRVLAPPVDFSVSFLPAKPFDFGDSHPFDAKLCQRLFDLFELEWFDDGFQFFLPIDAGVLVDWGSGSGREPNIVRAVWSPVPSQGEARVRVYSINHAWRAQPLTLILSPCARGEARKAVAST